MEIKVKLETWGIMPNRAHEADAGYDLFSPCDAIVKARGNMTIDTAVHMIIPRGYVGMVKSKSGLNTKHNILSEGVVDAEYTGTIRVKLYNHGDEDYLVSRGDKISQIVIMPIVTPELIKVDTLDETDRGSNGFGSTGK